MTIVGGLRYALFDILVDIRIWFVIGLAAAAVVDATVAPDTLARWGTGWTGMLVMLVVGLPMYICATSSTPLAAALMSAGVSPGAVIVFLLAGPATNAGGVLAIREELGTRSVVGYLFGVCSGAVLCGLGLDAMIASNSWDVVAQAKHVHTLVPQWVSLPSAALLALLLLRPKSEESPAHSHVEPA